MLQRWQYGKPDDFECAGKRVALAKFDERRLTACGERFVFIGHDGADGSTARAIVLAGNQRREVALPRRGGGHLLGGWLTEDDELAIVISDDFHVVDGIAVSEYTVSAKAKLVRTRKVLQLRRHIGKGHAELSLAHALRVGDRRYALASAGYRYRALLELEPKAKSFGSRVLAYRKADDAVFCSGGRHAVFYERGKSAVVVGLDGSELAQIKPPVPTGCYLSLCAAAPGRLGFSVGKLRGTDRVQIVECAPWPGSRVGSLGEVPRSAAIADLDVETARACSPEPVGYRRAGAPDAFAAVIGWALNADPATKQPVISHVIVTDLIVNFFAVKDRKLRLLFNFDRSAIQRVERDGDQLTIVTPSGRTVMRATRGLATTLGAVTAWSASSASRGSAGSRPRAGK